MSEDADKNVAVPSVYERLAEPFALSEHAKVNKGGMDQTYAPWTEYVERMNSVLGVENWSSRIVREGFTETECWVLAEVEAVIDGHRVVRQQYGCEPITKGRDAKPTTDLLKSTASDAMKKAISLLGPGLYLSVKEERVAIEAAMREAIKAAAEEKRNAGKPAATAKVDAAAKLTGAPEPPKPAGYFCVECHGLVKTDGEVTIPKKKGGPMVTVAVADFAPVVEQRLGGFHCPGCYEKKWINAA